MSLPTQIEKHRPNPLGDEAGRLALAEGLNLNQAADRIALESTPAKEMPRFLKTRAQDVEEAERKADQARAALEREASDYQRYLGLLDDLARKRQHIDAAQFRLAQAKTDVAGFQSDFSQWHTAQWSHLCERVSSTLIAERLIVEFPKWIAQAEKEVATLQGEADRLAKKYAE